MQTYHRCIDSFRFAKKKFRDHYATFFAFCSSLKMRKFSKQLLLEKGRKALLQSSIDIFNILLFWFQNVSILLHPQSWLTI